jgi:hypothetical protein
MNTKLLASVALMATESVFGFGCSSPEFKRAPPPPSPAQPAPAPAASDPADAGPTPPFAIDFPRVESAGGPVIKNGRVVPIVFKGDPLAASITEFTEHIAKSSYFADLGKEYGVESIAAGSTLTVDTPPPVAISVQEIESWLIDNLSGATPAFGAPDENTLYAVFYPPGVKVTTGEAGAVGESCEGYGGFHEETEVQGKPVAYAVLPRCGKLDALTVAASHELFEWASDPFPFTAPAYSFVDSAHWAWQATMVGELSDLCTFLDMETIRPSDIGFAVQRQWSNAASASGAFPCRPQAERRGYFQAIPHLEDEVKAFDYRSRDDVQFLRTKAIKLAQGETRTIDVYLYASEDIEGVRVNVETVDEAYERPSKSGFKLALSQSMARRGDVFQLTVTAPKADATDFVFLEAMKENDVFPWSVVVTTEKEVFPPGGTIDAP